MNWDGGYQYYPFLHSTTVSRYVLHVHNVQWNVGIDTLHPNSCFFFFSIPTSGIKFFNNYDVCKPFYGVYLKYLLQSIRKMVAALVEGHYVGESVTAFTCITARKVPVSKSSQTWKLYDFKECTSWEMYKRAQGMKPCAR